jgi:hypothetical protein
VEKRPKNPEAARKWFYKHREEVLQDLISLGKKVTCEKWGMPYQMIGHFYRKNPTHASKSSIALPTWSDTWDPTVQVKWLECFLEVRR